VIEIGMSEYEAFESPGSSLPQFSHDRMGGRIVVATRRPHIDEDPTGTRGSNGDHVPLSHVENDQLERTTSGKVATVAATPAASTVASPSGKREPQIRFEDQG
jgi:hypothetical protein